MKRARRGVGVLIIGLGLIVAMTGCESLRRKFSRTKKKTTQEAAIVSPRDYSAHPFPSDVMYRQYYTYWKSWNQELVLVLQEQRSHKKILDCAEQMVVNLKKMGTYLTGEKAGDLQPYIRKSEDLKDRIAGRSILSGSEMNSYRYEADRLLSSVGRLFSFSKVKGSLIEFTSERTAPEGSAPEVSGSPSAESMVDGQ